MAQYILQNADGSLVRPRQNARFEGLPPTREDGTKWVKAEPADVFTIPPRPVTPAAKLAAEAILAGINAEAQRRAQVQQRLYDLLWDNQDATTEEILTELGTEAAKVFMLSKKNVENLAAIAEVTGKPLTDYMHADYTKTEREIVVNPDGTVTLK